MKCCYNPENYLCGTKTDAVFNVYKNYGEKFGGGFVKNYQLNYYSKILFDFNAHVSSSTGPIMTSSKEDTLNFASCKLSLEPDASLKKVGTTDFEFETEDFYRKSPIDQLKDCFQKVLNCTNLSILYANDGIPANRKSEQDMRRNITDESIECIVTLKLYPYTGISPAYVDFIGKFQDGPNKIENIAYINEYTNKFFYNEDGSEILITLDECDYNVSRDNIFLLNTQINDTIEKIYKENDFESSFFYYKPVVFINYRENPALPFPTLTVTFNVVDNPYRLPENQVPNVKSISIPENSRLTFNMKPKQILPIPNQESEQIRFRTIYKNKLNTSCFVAGVIMHEFCHILGLVHEQQIDSIDNPYRDQSVFNASASKAYKILPNTSSITSFDPESIMLYSVTRCILKPEAIETQEQKEKLINTRYNLKLSDKDCHTLDFYYPKIILNTVENYYRTNKNINYILYFLVLFISLFLIILIIKL